MKLQDLTNWEIIGLFAVFAFLFSFLFAWFFEKIFEWDKAAGRERKKLSTKWHRIKAVLVGMPTGLIAYLAFGITWYAVLIWFFMAFIMWNAFDYFLNKLRNLKAAHRGENTLDGVPWLVKIGLLVVSIVLLIMFTK